MLPENSYHVVNSVTEALATAVDHIDSFQYVAGGTDVIVNRFQGNNIKKCLIDITRIDKLKNISLDDSNISIGSLVKLDDLKKHEIINQNFPALVEAAEAVGTPVVRKTASIGGNLLCENRCAYYNQSEWWRNAVGYCLKCEGDICIATGGTKACFSRFVSDIAPVLISYDASLEVIDKDGLKIIKLENIYTGDGLNPHNLNDTSLILSILIPLHKKISCVFKKLRPRVTADFTSLTTAVSMDENRNIKIAMSGVDPKPIVITGNSVQEKNELIKAALKKSRTVDNDFYSRTYRREMIKVFLERSFRELEGF